MPRALPQSLGHQTELPPLALDCTVEYLFQHQTIEDACRRLLHSNVDMVGFDMEWWTQFKTGVAPREVALIQLCYEEPQLESGPTDASRQQPGMTPALREVLECEAIAKAGVGINGDAEKLSLDHRVRLRGTLDIGAELNARVQPRGCELVERTAFTLADAAARLLRARLPKLQRLRCSNWEAAPLTAEQRRYAALDALASLRCARAALRLPLRKRAQLLDTAPAWQAWQVSQ